MHFLGKKKLNGHVSDFTFIAFVQLTEGDWKSIPGTYCGHFIWWQFLTFSRSGIPISIGIGVVYTAQYIEYYKRSICLLQVYPNSRIINYNIYLYGPTRFWIGNLTIMPWCKHNNKIKWALNMVLLVKYYQIKTNKETSHLRKYYGVMNVMITTDDWLLLTDGQTAYIRILIQ